MWRGCKSPLVDCMSTKDVSTGGGVKLPSNSLSEVSSLGNAHIKMALSFAEVLLTAHQRRKKRERTCQKNVCKLARSRNKVYRYKEYQNRANYFERSILTFFLNP